jgi:hypothetical protein
MAILMHWWGQPLQRAAHPVRCLGQAVSCGWGEEWGDWMKNKTREEEDCAHLPGDGDATTLGLRWGKGAKRLQRLNSSGCWSRKLAEVGEGGGLERGQGRWRTGEVAAWAGQWDKVVRVAGERGYDRRLRRGCQQREEIETDESMSSSRRDVLEEENDNNVRHGPWSIASSWGGKS